MKYEVDIRTNAQRQLDRVEVCRVNETQGLLGPVRTATPIGRAPTLLLAMDLIRADIRRKGEAAATEAASTVRLADNL